MEVAIDDHMISIHVVLYRPMIIRFRPGPSPFSCELKCPRHFDYTCSRLRSRVMFPMLLDFLSWSMNPSMVSQAILHWDRRKEYFMDSYPGFFYAIFRSCLLGWVVAKHGYQVVMIISTFME